MALDLILTQPQKPFKTADLSISEIFSYQSGFFAQFVPWRYYSS